MGKSNMACQQEINDTTDVAMVIEKLEVEK